MEPARQWVKAGVAKHWIGITNELRLQNEIQYWKYFGELVE